MKSRFLYILVLNILSGFGFLSAQTTSDYNWIFGPTGNGIRFDIGGIQGTASSGWAALGIGGSTVATDPWTGNLMFYSDGANVYDANNNIMPNGSGLNGATGSAQPVTVAAVPGFPGQYYIFTNTATPTAPGSVYYSIVDMNLYGNTAAPLPPGGEVISKNTQVSGIVSGVAQGMTVIPNVNCDGFWLITQRSGTDSYFVVEITDAGFVGVTEYGGLGGGLPMEAASLTYHQGTNRLAVAPENLENNVMILSVDPATGALGLVASVLNSGRMVAGTEAIYDTEWSPDGNYLYISIIGEAASGIVAEVIQYDVNNPTTTLANVLPSPIANSYGLKIGPDNNIYHLFQQSAGGSYLLGRIVDADSAAAKTSYEISPFSVANYGGKNFNTYLPDYDPGLAATIQVSGNCANTPSIFNAEVTPKVDSVLWDFGDGSTAEDLAPVYTYTAGGTMNVEFTAWLNGKSTTVTQSVDITQFALQINLVQDTVGCKCEFPVYSTEPECAGASAFMEVTADISGGTPTSILWSNGDTGATLTPDEPGYYYVVVTDATGCSQYAGVNVREYGVIDFSTAVWYFGNQAGINFDTFPDPPEPLDNGVMTAPEGSSAASNKNGDLIFYTDGDKVWDKNHVEVASGIGGDPGSTTSVLIVPYPGDETLYYIFTTNEVYGTGTYEVRYSIFDVKQRNGDGDLLETNQFLMANSTERLAFSGGWLLAHEFGNNTFVAYPITSTGIGVPVYTGIGSNHEFGTPENAQGYMEFSLTGKVAVALSDPGNYNYVEIFDFDFSTGTLSNYHQVDLNEPSGQVYGLEFSPGGSKLYATVSGPSSVLVEINWNQDGEPGILQKINESEELGAIETSPNGGVYVAVNNANALGLITVVEDTLSLSSFNLNGQPLAAGTTSTLGLPAFAQTFGSGPQAPGIVATNLCIGSATEMTVSGTDIIDNFAWDFGDGAIASGEVVTHTYASPGTYTVEVLITNRCGLSMIVTRDVTIYPIPATPTTPATANICSGPVTLQAADPADPEFANYSFIWSTGETTNTITVSEQSLVSVTIVNQGGCTSYRQTLVTENRPLVDLGPDLTVCQNQTVLPLDAGNSGATFNWTKDGAFSGATQTQTVDTTIPGVYTYEVTVTDPLTGCSITDDIIYTVEALPIVVVTPTNSPGCNQNNGTITIDIQSEGSFSYFINGLDQNGGVYFRNGINQFGPLVITQTAVPVGTFTVIIMDEVSSCLFTAQVIILDDGSVMDIPLPVSNPGCGVVSANVNITDGTYDGSSGFNYILTNLDNTDITTGTATVEPFNTAEVIPGNYTLLVEDIATTCTQIVGPFVINESTPATLTFDPVDECADVIAITANSDATSPQFTWTGPAGFIGSGQTINPPATGYYLATVEDLTLNKCPITDSVYVYVNNFQPVINVVGDPCSGQVILSVEPSDAFYSYLWTGPTSGGQQLLVGPAESGTYSVQVRDQNSGCIKTSEPVTVNVVESFSVALTNTLACDNGTPFTVTATATADVSYAWYLDNTLLEGENSSTLETTSGGTYKTVVSKGGCESQDVLAVDLLPFSPPDLPNRVFICDDPDNPKPETGQYELSITPPYADYQWRKDGTLISTDPTYLATESGNYSVDLVNEFGCTATDAISILTQCDPIINAPDAFSPNGNAQNDEFFVYTTFLTDEFDIKLYNRWGELVYQSSDKNFRWNGRYNNSGDLLPGGVYVYILRYTSEYEQDKGVQELRSSVMLLR